jgi:hypothetical protein
MRIALFCKTRNEISAKNLRLETYLLSVTPRQTQYIRKKAWKNLKKGSEKEIVA